MESKNKLTLPMPLGTKLTSPPSKTYDKGGLGGGTPPILRDDDFLSYEKPDMSKFRSLILDPRIDSQTADYLIKAHNHIRASGGSRKLWFQRKLYGKCGSERPLGRFYASEKQYSLAGIRSYVRTELFGDTCLDIDIVSSVPAIFLRLAESCIAPSDPGAEEVRKLAYLVSNIEESAEQMDLPVKLLKRIIAYKINGQSQVGLANCFKEAGIQKEKSESKEITDMMRWIEDISQILIAIHPEVPLIQQSLGGDAPQAPLDKIPAPQTPASSTKNPENTHEEGGMGGAAPPKRKPGRPRKDGSGGRPAPQTPLSKNSENTNDEGGMGDAAPPRIICFLMYSYESRIVKKAAEIFRKCAKDNEIVGPYTCDGFIVNTSDRALVDSILSTMEKESNGFRWDEFFPPIARAWIGTEWRLSRGRDTEYFDPPKIEFIVKDWPIKQLESRIMRNEDTIAKQISLLNTITYGIRIDGNTIPELAKEVASVFSRFFVSDSYAIYFWNPKSRTMCCDTSHLSTFVAEMELYMDEKRISYQDAKNVAECLKTKLNEGSLDTATLLDKLRGKIFFKNGYLDTSTWEFSSDETGFIPFNRINRDYDPDVKPSPGYWKATRMLDDGINTSGRDPASFEEFYVGGVPPPMPPSMQSSENPECSESTYSTSSTKNTNDEGGLGGASPPTWKACQMRRALMFLIGKALIGAQLKNTVVVETGRDRGKSAFIELLRCALGIGKDQSQNYLALLSGSCITLNGSAKKDAKDNQGLLIAGLPTCSVIIADEPPEKSDLDDHLVKCIEGNSLITARHLFRPSICKFVTQGRLFIFCNKLPVCSPITSEKMLSLSFSNRFVHRDPVGPNEILAETTNMEEYADQLIAEIFYALRNVPDSIIAPFEGLITRRKMTAKQNILKNIIVTGDKADAVPNELFSVLLDRNNNIADIRKGLGINDGTQASAKISKSNKPLSTAQGYAMGEHYRLSFETAAAMAHELGDDELAKQLFDMYKKPPSHSIAVQCVKFSSYEKLDQEIIDSLGGVPPPMPPSMQSPESTMNISSTRNTYDEGGLGGGTPPT